MLSETILMVFKNDPQIKGDPHNRTYSEEYDPIVKGHTERNHSNGCGLSLVPLNPNINVGEKRG
jgi:hypothetical protein